MPSVLFCHADQDREYATRLAALLAERAEGRLELFFVDEVLASISPNTDVLTLRRRIEAEIVERDCRALVAVIGPGWLRSLLAAPAADADPDPLRLALGCAHAMRVHVCPVFTDGPKQLRAPELTEDLGFLARDHIPSGRDLENTARLLHRGLVSVTSLPRGYPPPAAGAPVAADPATTGAHGAGRAGAAAPDEEIDWDGIFGDIIPEPTQATAPRPAPDETPLPPDDDADAGGSAGSGRDGVGAGTEEGEWDGVWMGGAGDTAPQPAAGDVAGDTDNRAYDDNVQFTVYRPAGLSAGAWQTMLAFAHLGESRDDGAPDPLGEVSRQAEAVLGDAMADFRTLVSDAATAIPRQGEISFVPAVPGVDFNPPRRTFRWQEDVHREEFRLRAGPDMVGSTARGWLAVFLGAILLAEIPLSMRVTGPESTRPRPQPASARPYRRIFPSYSHADSSIVATFRAHAEALGDDFLQDVLALRAGERWSERLLALIESADVFQLFWSWNALASPYVTQEWRHALALGRRQFVRPCYWERPLPTRRGAPPSELRELHFHFLGGSAAALAGRESAHDRIPAKRPPRTGLPPDIDAGGSSGAGERTEVPDVAAGGSSAPRRPPATDDQTSWPAPAASRDDLAAEYSSGGGPRRGEDEDLTVFDPGVLVAGTAPDRAGASAGRRTAAGGRPRRAPRLLAVALGYVVLVAGVVALIAVLGALLE